MSGDYEAYGVNSLMLFSETSQIFISTFKGQGVYLKQEVEALGYEIKKVQENGLTLMGTMIDCIRLNMMLRTANAIYYSIGQFDAHNSDELYNRASKIKWDEYMDENSYFTISSAVNNPSIQNNLFANLKLKDSIVDYFYKHYDRRPNSGPSYEGIVVHLYWVASQVEIFLDTSGATLSKHGYRNIPWRAPMIESLASSVILASEWSGDTHFINPMCGSGTLAIEAACIALGMYPTMRRSNFAFMHINGYVEEFFLETKKEMRSLQKAKPKIKIIATDRDRKAITAAKQNARAAGVEEFIHFEVCDYADTPIPKGNGTVIINPEYGIRLGEIEDLQKIYKGMGDFFKQKCSGYRAFVFTGNIDLSKMIGLKPFTRKPFYNGKIECKLLGYKMYSGKKYSEMDVSST